MLKKVPKSLVAIFLFGIILRIISVYPFNTIIGFDQARDLWDATTIYRDFNLRIIGPTAGNNPNLHHGILYLYYLIPPLFISGGSPMAAVYWNIFVNSLSIIVLFFLTHSLFKSRRVAFISAFLAAISLYFVEFSGWLSNPSPTLFTVPLFFLGLWHFIQKNPKGLVLAGFALGLSIEFELFFIYLIPVFLIAWLLTRYIPQVKYLILSVLAFCFATATMIITELKFNFAGVAAIFGAGKLVGEQIPLSERLANFLSRYLDTVDATLFGDRLQDTRIIGVVLFIGIIWLYLSMKKKRKQVLFLIIYALSPAIMLLLGTHNAPWFLIGFPPAIILITALLLSKIKSNILLAAILVAMLWLNFSSILDVRQKGQELLGPDKSAMVATQLQAIDYTYIQSENHPFTINSVTNPLYINAIWSYHYTWYGQKKYGFLPSWSGGDQLYPYDVLQKSTGEEEYLFLIMDASPRLAFYHRQDAIKWAEGVSKLIEEIDFGQIKVQKRRLFTNN